MYQVKPFYNDNLEMSKHNVMYKVNNFHDQVCLEHTLSTGPYHYPGKYFLGGAVTFTLGVCCSLLRRIPDKNDRCAFTRGSRGEVMIFF
jgi:hypothetical protein